MAAEALLLHCLQDCSRIVGPHLVTPEWSVPANTCFVQTKCERISIDWKGDGFEQPFHRSLRPLLALLASDTLYACIDVRERGEFARAQIAGTSPVNRGALELRLPVMVPDKTHSRGGVLRRRSP